MGKVGRIMVFRISGIVLALIGIWQLFAAWKYYRFLRTKGTKNSFSPLALYYGALLGLIALIIGLWMFFSPETIVQLIGK